jgi:hypothetical protein
MSNGNPRSIVCRLRCWAAILCVATLASSPAQAAFHIWNITEIYSNASGTLQFIEMFDPSGFQNFISNQQIKVSNVGNTQSKTFTIPPESDLPGDSLNHRLLFGTSGLKAAGGPTPDFIIPNNFLFTAGGSIQFFGANSGNYTAMPIDGILSRTWGTNNNAINSPVNYAGQTGTVSAIPEPTSLILTPLAMGLYGLYRRRTRRDTVPVAT